jgi:hypothetical protein
LNLNYIKGISHSHEDVSVVCAITHGLYKPWIDILHLGQVPTWLSLPLPNNFEVIHFHGKAGGKIVTAYDKLHERIRWTNRWVAAPLRWFDEVLGYPLRRYIPRTKISTSLALGNPSVEIGFMDIYATMKWKDLAILNYFYTQTDANYLFMTTTSSYLRPYVLMSIVEELPRSNVYAGAVAYSGATFAAGNNRLFSRDVVEQILNARSSLQCGIIEDLALGNLCSQLGVDLIELSKRNISSEEELQFLTDEDIGKEFHFRLTSGTRNNRQDVEIMRALHNRVGKIDGF